MWYYSKSFSIEALSSCHLNDNTGDCCYCRAMRIASTSQSSYPTSFFFGFLDPI